MIKEVGRFNEVCDKVSLQGREALEISKWNKESKLSILHGFGGRAEETSDGAFLIKGKRADFYTHQKGPGILKFGLMLLERPASNVFSFKLAGWEQFDFFYQRPLANVAPDGSTWEKNEFGGVSHRPVDVNGSYAVYHKTKRDHVLGQTNYQTGKFCHIFRPRFIDREGRTCWGDLKIERGVYSVTIPEWFLNLATYPVRANDTIGITTVGATDDNGNNGVHHFAKNTSPSTASYTTLKIATWYSGGGTNIKMAIYTDNAGSPSNGTLVANSSTGAKAITQTTKPTVDAEWTSGAITASLTSGSVYWLAWATDSDNSNIAKDDTQGVRNSKANTYASFPKSPNDTYAGGTTNGQTWSIYAMTTPAGGDAVPVCWAQNRRRNG